MMHWTLKQYCQNVQSAWNAKDGDRFGELVSCRDIHVRNTKLHLEKPEEEFEFMLRPPVDEIVSGHLKVLWALANDNPLEACRCQTYIVHLFAKSFEVQKEGNWTLPIMCNLCLDVRLIGTKAMKRLRRMQSSKSSEVLEQAADSLMACFRICAADNRSSETLTKKWGMLHLVNHMLRIYFTLEKFNLCKPLIRAIDSSSLKDHYCVAQLVTYNFYVGRKAMFDCDYKTANDCLTYAFERCLKTCWKNKRVILMCLIPVKMTLGYMPKKSLLEKYDLLEFWEIVEAVKQGNLRLFIEVIEKFKIFFTSAGVLLILERLKVNAYRCLFKKVYQMLNIHQIPIATFQKALHFVGENDVDIAETHCIIANLINEGKIKGYISHQHNKLVVSKQNAFPPLASL